MSKTLNDYMNMHYRVEIIEDEDEGGFVAYYPDLPGCITCGETEEEAFENALDAKEAWFEATLEMKTLSDMDQAVENMKEGIVSPAIDLSDFE